LSLIAVHIGKGDDNFRFPVYESIIRKSSKFFDNAMKPEWAAARTHPRTFDLTAEDPKLFKNYLHWLYLRTLATVLTEVEEGHDSDNNILSMCCVLGDKIIDVDFKNAVVTALIESMEKQPCSYKPTIPGCRTISMMYAKTTEGSPLRRLLVDMWVNNAGVSSVRHLTEKLPHDFVLEFPRALLLSKRVPKEDTRTWKEHVKDYYEE
jgi:hypothetical protein